MTQLPAVCLLGLALCTLTSVTATANDSTPLFTGNVPSTPTSSLMTSSLSVMSNESTLTLTMSVSEATSTAASTDTSVPMTTPTNISISMSPSIIQASSTNFVSTTVLTTSSTPLLSPASSFNSASLAVTTSTPPPVDRYWAALGVALLILLAGIVVAFALCCIILKKLSVAKALLANSYNKRLVECDLEEMSPSDAQSTLFAHLSTAQLSSFPAHSLPEYVDQLHEENNYRAEDEYDEVKSLDCTVSTEHASLGCNELRNRYTNILPRDSTRVMLRSLTKVPGSDYINANFISGYNKPLEYIAAQGPLPSTCADFWRMVWEYDVANIIMVTNLEENSMVKCHKYWPCRGSSQFGTINIRLNDQLIYPDFSVRRFSVTNVATKVKATQIAAPRLVTQYHFITWPDFGVPKEASAMIKFVRKVRNSIDSAHGPLVIHCSAGVGRTGTFIAVDVLTQKIDAGEVINVQEFVCRMRSQRSFMVQTAAQYMFIYDCLLYYYLHGNKEVSAGSLSNYVSLMDVPQEEKEGATPLDREFQDVLSISLPNGSLFTVAMDDCNQHKNRDHSNVPLDDNRVVLDNLSSAPGQDYINASFITGYYNRIEFIATQHPLQSTRDSFWNMIVERNIKTIVMLGPLENPEDCYWPTGFDDTRIFDSDIIVSLLDRDDEECIGLTIREFDIVSVKSEEPSHVLKHFHLHSWPVDGAPNQTTSTMILVEQSRDQWKQTGFELIVVHTAAGVTSEAAGVYCGLCLLNRQMDVEDCVDVFSTAQKLRKQRPSLITSKDYYRFLYNVLESTLEKGEECEEEEEN